MLGARRHASANRQLVQTMPPPRATSYSAPISIIGSSAAGTASPGRRASDRPSSRPASVIAWRSSLRANAGEDVVAPHRVADLQRAGGQAVDLGRLSRQATPSLDFEVTKRDKPLEMIEGDRAVDARGARHVVDAPRLAVGVEAKEDVAAGEIPERAQRALHVRRHDMVLFARGAI